MSERIGPAMRERPILYSFRRCPYAMRGRMALIVSGQQCAVREVLLRDKPAEMLEVSAKGTVPVLVLLDGTVIDESLDVMRWALARHDPENWLAPEDSEVDTIIETIDGPFKHHLDRYKYSTRHDSDPITHRDAASAILAEFDYRLEGRDNLTGDTRSLVDIASFPFIRQFAMTDRSWFDGEPWGNLRAWLDCHLQSDLFAAAMVKLPLWKSGDPAGELPAYSASAIC